MRRARARVETRQLRQRAIDKRIRRLFKQVRRGEMPQPTPEPPDACPHEWERDGQTMLSVRLICTLCGKRTLW